MHKAKDTALPRLAASLCCVPVTELCCVLTRSSTCNHHFCLTAIFLSSPWALIMLFLSENPLLPQMPGNRVWAAGEFLGPHFDQSSWLFSPLCCLQLSCHCSFSFTSLKDTSLRYNAIPQTLCSVNCRQLPMLSAKEEERWIRQSLCPWKGCRWVRERDLDTIRGNKNQVVMSRLKEVFKNRILWENGAEKNMFWMSRLWVAFQRSYLSLAVKEECERAKKKRRLKWK